jgi:hypothetical protein
MNLNPMRLIGLWLVRQFVGKVLEVGHNSDQNLLLSFEHLILLGLVYLPH